MGFARKLMTIGAMLGLGLAVVGCCGGGSKGDGDKSSTASSDDAKAKPGQTVKGPGSDFSITVDKAEVTDAIGTTKPTVPAGAKWIIVRYRLKNDGKEAKSPMLDFKENLADKSGGKYEASTDGKLALMVAEPNAEDATLDKIPVGSEIKQIAVFAVPADKATGEVDMVFEQLIALMGKPKQLTVSVPVVPKAVAAPAGTTKPAPKK